MSTVLHCDNCDLSSIAAMPEGWSILMDLSGTRIDLCSERCVVAWITRNENTAIKSIHRQEA